MKYNIIENFIDPSECKNLIYEESQILNKSNMLEVLNKRMLLPSTIHEFLHLIENSISWNNLHTMLNSQNFLNLILEKLNIQKNNFKVTNFFFQKNLSTTLKKYKSLNHKKISLINDGSLFKYLIFRIFRKLERIIKYKYSYTDYVELIYDYSISPNGYKREIHRDSDSRTLIFLLYLNELSKNGTGGDLEIYKYNNHEPIPPQPDYNDCTLVETIPPKPGRLVVFQNSYESLHAVNEMKNHDGNRHFLYGSFTLLAKKNKFLKQSANSLKTEYNIFD